MKRNADMKDIIELCREIDGKAAAIYLNFHKNTVEPELVALWKEMSEDEKTHISYWQYLLDLSKEVEIPQLFDDPGTIKDQLSEIIKKTDEYIQTSIGLKDHVRAFTIACHLELFMIHKSFVKLFYYMEAVSEEKDHTKKYFEHLGRFVTSLKNHVHSLETHILADVIIRMWRDYLDLVVEGSTDDLTGLFNRRGFYQVVIPLVYLAQREKNNIGILMIDVDEFKKINDTYGHQAGDKILKTIGTGIRESIRRSDIGGRYGGEEFIVMLPDVEADSLFAVAEKIRGRIETETIGKMPITVSIGVSQDVLGGSVEKDLEKLIKKADENLYKAKSAGKNKVLGP